MKRTMRTVSVILPAFNEQIALPLVLSQLDHQLAGIVPEFEVIVVDDGSTDKTARWIKQLQTYYPWLRLIRHEKNRGYGEALRSGFMAAKHEWVLLMDSDGQFDIADLERLLPYVETHELILGYRERRADGFARDFLTGGYMVLIRVLFGLDVRDVGCGFKLFTRRSWELVQPIRSRDHKIFTVEWLWKAEQRGVRIMNVAVRHLPRRGGQPTGARVDVLWQMVRELIRLRLHARRI